MSLIPMLFSDWWEDLDRPHRLWDQHFGTGLDPTDLDDLVDPASAEILLYRPHSRRARRRFHPFLKGGVRKGRGVSTVQADKDKFQVTLDVTQFSPEDINVKVADQNVVVEAKHEEKEDEHGWVSRHFIRKYIVPSQCDIDKVQSHLSTDGILSITVPRKEAPKAEGERTVKIQYTGKPALANVNDDANGTLEQQKDQQPQQREQQQQQQEQQQKQQQQSRLQYQQQTHQQYHRGRKGGMKS